jgi:KaiC/GvpD/RAD55 family RecA-like ATPase
MKALESTTSIRSGTFWSQLKPGEHLLQCWNTEASLIDALEGFVSSGLREGEGVVMIATASHLHEVEKRVRRHWIDIDRARWEGRYIPLLAPETLGKFMDDDGMPDAERFDTLGRKLVERAGAQGARRVRLFGEMVGALWGQGNTAGAIQLENLWERFIHENGVPLFCAYARSLFAADPQAFRGVCEMHSLVLPG